VENAPVACLSLSVSLFFDNFANFCSLFRVGWGVGYRFCFLSNVRVWYFGLIVGLVVVVPLVRMFTPLGPEMAHASQLPTSACTATTTTTTEKKKKRERQVEEKMQEKTGWIKRGVRGREKKMAVTSG
jgi:hypothetical protein